MFPISMITGEPLWNSLPAAKIINYPLEKADYKPYAQARVCISNDDLHLQLLAFEVEPEEKSIVGAALAFYPEEDGGRRYFWFSTNRSGALVCKFIDETNGTEQDISKNLRGRGRAGRLLVQLLHNAACRRRAALRHALPCARTQNEGKFL